MKLSYADRVLETTTTQGTGPITLLGATVGCQSFIQGVGTGKKVCYTIEDGQNWEVGTGIVTAGASDTLSRDVILESSANGSPVNWGPGTRNVFISASSHVLTWLNDAGMLNDDNVVGTDNIKNEAVTPAKMKKMPTLTLMGNKTGADGVPQNLTPSEVNAMLNNNGIYGQCYFAYATNATCKLSPRQGNKVTFPSGAAANIPTAGITTTVTSAYLNGVAAQPLVAGTLYYAYLWNQNPGGAANYVIDWSTTGHSQDATTGIEIKIGFPDRVLVGMAVPQAGPVFAFADGNLLVASWFNRRRARSKVTKSTATTISNTAAYAEVSNQYRNNFLCWADSPAQFWVTGAAQVASTGGSLITSMGFDSTSVAEQDSSFCTQTTVGWSLPISVHGYKTLTEGQHYSTILGKVTTASFTYIAGAQDGATINGIAVEL